MTFPPAHHLYITKKSTPSCLTVYRGYGTVFLFEKTMITGWTTTTAVTQASVRRFPLLGAGAEGYGE
jgi:hypothetical protein